MMRKLIKGSYCVILLGKATCTSIIKRKDER